MGWNERVNFEALKGKTITEIVTFPSNDELQFICDDGMRYKMYHSQDCCENVSIESIVGDLKDLIGNPVLLAEVVAGETPNEFKFEYEPESYTWTFYKLATIKGYVDIRWLGESNGYYSESVDFELMN